MIRTTQGKIIITNIVSIIVLALGLFGIDVDPDVQAEIVAGIGALALVITTALAAFRSRGQLVADEVDASIKRRQKEGGFAHVSHLWAVGVLSVAALLLAGCNHMPETPRQALGASYAAVESIADSTAIAYRDGHITDEQRQSVREELTRAMETLQLAEAAITQGLDADNLLVSARQILAQIQLYLIEAQSNE